MARDYYAESEEIAAALSAAGRHENALAITDAIAGGCTSSEVFADLSNEFDRVLDAGPLPNGLESRVRELRDAVDQAFDS
jgi:tRNA A37 threonylcarbamoyladenosine synthetase subunit TsaC/SUA5/YrdC